MSWGLKSLAGTWGMQGNAAANWSSLHICKMYFLPSSWNIPALHYSYSLIFCDKDCVCGCLNINFSSFMGFGILAITIIRLRCYKVQVLPNISFPIAPFFFRYWSDWQNFQNKSNTGFHEIDDLFVPFVYGLLRIYCKNIWMKNLVQFIALFCGNFSIIQIC